MIVAVLVTFLALVVSHQLSPYVIVIQLGVLAAVGKLRTRWLPVFLLVMALAYLAPRFSFVDQTYGLFSSLGNFFGNSFPPSVSALTLSHDQQIVADAARLLSATVWGLALLGIWRRWRTHRPVLTLGILAFSPFLLLGLQGYGGEALLRVYLFSLPWSVCLAASALAPQPGGWQGRRWLYSSVAILLVGSLFVPAYFGADSINVVTPNDIAASTYLDVHARAGTVIYLDQDFPINIGSRYPLFSNQLLLVSSEMTESFPLTSDAVTTITSSAIQDAVHGRPVYLVTTSAMVRYADAYGLTPQTSVRPLEAALDRSTQWRVLFRRNETVIYVFNQHVR